MAIDNVGATVGNEGLLGAPPFVGSSVGAGTADNDGIIVREFGAVSTDGPEVTDKEGLVVTDAVGVVSEEGTFVAGGVG